MKGSFIAGLATGATIGAVAGLMMESGNKKKSHCMGRDGFFKSMGTVIDSFISH